MLHMICTRLHPCRLRAGVGGSLQCSEEIVKNIELHLSVQSFIIIISSSSSRSSITCCFGLVAYHPSNMLVYLRDGSAQTINVLPHVR